MFIPRHLLRSFMIVILLITGLNAQCAAQNMKRLALVIGNDNYQNFPKLKAAVNDASAMSRELKAAGFEVSLHQDLNYRGMVTAVENFSSKISGGDNVVVFYAGHGVQTKTGNYLIPVDFDQDPKSDTIIEKTSYALQDIMDRLNEAKAMFSLVMVDACRVNILGGKNKRNLSITKGLSSVEPPKGQMVVFSASRGQEALDSLGDADQNPNGVFTREVISRIHRPGLRIEDLVREVQDSVEALARSVEHEQRPALYNEARGNFYFFPPMAGSTVSLSKPGAQPSAQPSTPDPENEAWAAAIGSNQAPAYSAYLDAYPAGRYAPAAKIKLAGLKPAAVVPAQPAPIAPPAPSINTANNNPPNALASEAYQRGLQFEKAGNFVEAIREFQEAAENGSASAQLKMAVRYEFGFGVPKNQAEAIRWYRMAAELGNLSARAKLQSLDKPQ